MKHYNKPEIELLAVNSESDVIRTSSLRLVDEGTGRDWDVQAAVNEKLKNKRLSSK